MKARVQRIFGALEEPVDLVVLTNGVEPHLDLSFFYVTDLVLGGLFERSAAVCAPDGRVEVLTSPLEEPSARRAPEAAITIFQNQDERTALLADRLKGVRTIGINGNEAVHADVEAVRKLAPDAKLVDVGKAVQKARLVKDRIELERMRKAADVASAVAAEIPALLEAGMREYELAAEIGYRMQKRGASGPSFSTIVAFGETSAEPHYTPSDRRLEKGQFVLCDFGAYLAKYASDITRTWVYGKGTDEMRAIYETVRRAQEAALATIAPGVKGGTVHEAVARVIDASPWKGRMTHSTGHTLGLGVHDGGVMHPRYDLTLEEGMVLTVEPGIYVPGLGGVRIEDDVVVTRNGVESLTDADKAYREVL